MSATARIVGGAAAVVVGVVLVPWTGGASLSLAYAGAGLAPSGLVPCLRRRPTPESGR